MIEFRSIRDAQHYADAATIEECHIRRGLEQKGHAQRIAIKSDRPFEILHVDEDLADPRKGRADWSRSGQDFLLSNSPGCRFPIARLLTYYQRSSVKGFMKSFLRASAFVVAFCSVSGF